MALGKSGMSIVEKYMFIDVVAISKNLKPKQKQDNLQKLLN